MKSLQKFICKVAKVEMFMVVNPEELNCLFIIRETPKSKDASWDENEYKYWHRDEATQKFLKLVSFWCN